jgi:hypothetical protein
MSNPTNDLLLKLFRTERGAYLFGLLITMMVRIGILFAIISIFERLSGGQLRWTTLVLLFGYIFVEMLTLSGKMTDARIHPVPEERSTDPTLIAASINEVTERLRNQIRSEIEKKNDRGV